MLLIFCHIHHYHLQSLLKCVQIIKNWIQNLMISNRIFGFFKPQKSVKKERIGTFYTVLAFLSVQLLYFHHYLIVAFVIICNPYYLVLLRLLICNPPAQHFNNYSTFFSWIPLSKNIPSVQRLQCVDPLKLGGMECGHELCISFYK